MRLKTNRQTLGRDVSLRVMASVHTQMAKHFQGLLDGRNDKLELVWFFKDKKGKVMPIGRSNKMSFRRNQLWRQFTDDRHNECTVHLIDMISGIQSSRAYPYAKKMSTKGLREEMVGEILGLNSIRTW